MSWWELSPGSAVIGQEQFEFELAAFVGYGITEDYAVSWVPENHGVEEAFGIAVGELELPVLAGICSVVDAGLVAGTGGHEERFIGRERYYGSEVQSGGI